ncbi:hypothetical protein Sta7437_1425 [Stanieria cyanosphaera PCC 7437]|uniref:DUF2808 domain-containing protein n=1 Tax=Stanieria cyanosphaera (strain ATCC 29371 / PCC 7437) TaxID=111780 RepID=K9XTK1_STAC7|nr:DUF2808 domain-containing protein [Stanieria cyanosphaera]AFZ34992.1 hypothetical protein Sta7437_1425 [Stanieria cyanosphaera PCC 7437]
MPKINSALLKIAVTLISIVTLELSVIARPISAQTTISQSQTPSFFRKSPRLLDAFATHSGVRMWSATYYFDLVIPADAEASLQTIVINQRRGMDEINFDLKKTVAYLGNHRHKEEQLAIKNVSQDEKTKVITIVLSNPISPGKNFTVGLKPKRNPDYEGEYLFGVTVFPAGNNPRGLYLGPGRLHFYRGNDSLFDL